MTKRVELGLDTFGDLMADADGKKLSYAQTLRNVVEQGVLADSVGVDFFGVGEHHRDDFTISAPEIVLAAIAARTKQIKLGTAVTVLSSDDPVRLFERFATLDAVSNGRAELHVGRGSFTESFPLFGFSVNDYNELFEEKLELLVEVLKEGPITWQGSVRPPLKGQQAYPKTESGSIPTWVAVGGSPESVVRAARHGLPLMIAIIGGPPARFTPFADLYRRALVELGKPTTLPIGVHCPGFVAETDAEAADLFWPHHKVLLERLGGERGWPPPTRARFDAEIRDGALHVGSPETVAKKIAATVQVLGLQRFQLTYASGPMPQAPLLKAIELYGTKVMPRVRELLA